MRIVFVAILLLASATVAEAFQTYSYVELPFDAVAINDAGVVVGTDGPQALRWENGVTTFLGSGSPIAINNHGVVLGSDWFWRPGVGRVMPGFQNATNFNDNEIVVGQILDGHNSNGAYAWNSVTGAQVIRVPFDDGFETGYFIPTDINDNAAPTIALYFDLWQGRGGYGFWRNENDNEVWGQIFPEMGSFTLPPGFVNNAGYGTAETVTAVPGVPCFVECLAAAIYGPGGSATYVGLLGIDGAGETGISGFNDQNILVGTRSVDGIEAVIGSAALGLVDLNSLIDPSNPLPQGLSFVEGKAINNVNQVLAEGSDGHSYLLTAVVPLPSTAWLFLSGLTALGVRRRNSNCRRIREANSARPVD